MAWMSVRRMAGSETGLRLTVEAADKDELLTALEHQEVVQDLADVAAEWEPNEEPASSHASASSMCMLAEDAADQIIRLCAAIEETKIWTSHGEVELTETATEELSSIRMNAAKIKQEVQRLHLGGSAWCDEVVETQ